ncbi:CAP domain-containing protein [Paenibacillus sp.]|uniref:CAP domain-containing protein n=1 Tax=Paenibacillus sp. TaxID=58172 RepID=UPI002D259E96|nr:CAP domain-containing protein [Paenibacillus sp.]HZG56510.1 CAP domain-containing protein [Paenibacillus sp.]
MLAFLRRWRRRLLALGLAGAALFAFATAAWAFGPGSKGADVYAVQAMLRSMGYYQGKIDGSYGAGTANGVKAYQRTAGLRATGTVDAATLRSILQAYTRLKTAPAPTGQAPTGAGGSGGAGANVASYAVSAAEREMSALVNAARAEANLPPLTLHVELSRVARFKSEDMAANGYFSHDSPTYGSPFQMMSDFRIAYSSAGENIACNQTVQRAHEALMNSPGHRANVLSADFTHIGIGVSNGGPCGAMYTQMFMKP